MQQTYIRAARAGDDDVLARLDRENWSTVHSVQPRPAPPHEPFFSERFGPRDHLVAEVEGRIVGYIRLGFPTPLAVNAHVRQILGFVVAEETRGKGVGRELIRAVVAEARRQGARRLTLRVLGHNTPARTLYESEGFVTEGVLPGEFLLDGQYVDDVLMGRTL
ncbi:GNAT family N-acetyltransferase [Streptomyces spectabilis]|uniref:GNAT family N-acetyltransferase n=1 Tax=Streptomyces spectabilis TaxID=68270 RepID=A0A5P2X3B1_STRST|nr:GNAT family N-acetyltransferase [Streptomyces spectabilis]MBB5102909.1 RimJ/RimL family protein N-acetyltransferase [Streptomyces spectabilis]MCI3902110.1 GNAT family N-acetyltransferase [Streptomyces spectabilis]QEV59497.1 GNAT family N-acetyltransferase [Streptomyces spectabilis]GGV15926.1 N-acetyltransferase [Streptomyces spectabilis]